MLPFYDTSNGTIIPPEHISPEYADFNRTHKALRRQDRTTMVIIDENKYEYVETMATIQMYVKYNQYGNNPHAQTIHVPYEPHGYPAFARVCNELDGSGFRWGTYDYDHGFFNYVTEGHVATLLDMQARDEDISPPLPAGMVLVREAEFREGQEAIIGRDRMRRRAEDRKRDAKAVRARERAAAAVNSPEIIALRREKQRELTERRAAKLAEAQGAPEVQGAPIASGSGVATTQAAEADVPME
ncbi:hypothetical protein C8R46DRAFT_1274141 [Mycena filopes]|nr:hypothetical protein C8R46DRAFT_1274141 [Mycena filopes]